VAATVLRLWEDGKLNLEDPVERYISEEHANLLRSGGYEPDRISLYHLLTHSSGMAEHTRTEKYQLPFIKSNYHWTRTAQIRELVEFTEPVGAIGEKFSYSDTGYVLLGEVIETVTNTSLGEAINEQLGLHDLGLHSIHWEEAGGEKSEERIHQYYQNEDTYDINPTLDFYGGGGLLANTHDLSLFFKLLVEGKVFKKATTLEKMLTKVNYNTPPMLDYRMGIWETEIEGYKAYTHSGFWGTQVAYIPELKTSIAANYSQYWNKRGDAPIIPIVLSILLEDNSESSL
jgi:D-alanyl-D-alanine carboxypeptidase